MPGLAVLINRAARRFARDPELIGAVRAAAGADAVVVDTHDLAELDAAARQVHHADPDTVALCGGDGSYSAGLTALRAAYGRGAALPRIALIPGGTVSTIARNYRVSGPPAAELSRVAALHAAGALPTRRHATLDANGKLGSIFGAALVANFFDLYYAEGAAGYGDAARMVARIFAESFVGGPYARRVLEPVRCDLAVDGVALSHERYSLICCATIQNLGLGMNVSYRAGEREDALHLVASALPPRRLGPQMFRVLAGKRIRGEAQFDGFAREFRVGFPQPGAWVLDGDVMYDRTVHVSPGPAIELVMGD